MRNLGLRMTQSLVSYLIFHCLKSGEGTHRTQLERSYYLPEGPYHSMRDPHDGYMERGHDSWASARYRHPSHSRSLPERLEPYEGRAGSFDGQLHPTSASLLPERAHVHMPHPRARLLGPAPAGGPWPPQTGEYANDRQPPQRRILLHRAGPEGGALGYPAPPVSRAPHPPRCVVSGFYECSRQKGGIRSPAIG